MVGCNINCENLQRTASLKETISFLFQNSKSILQPIQPPTIGQEAKQKRGPLMDDYVFIRLLLFNLLDSILDGGSPLSSRGQNCLFGHSKYIKYDAPWLVSPELPQSRMMWRPTGSTDGGDNNFSTNFRHHLSPCCAALPDKKRGRTRTTGNGRNRNRSSPPSYPPSRANSCCIFLSLLYIVVNARPR